MLSAFFLPAIYPWFEPFMSFIFLIYLLSTTCSHTCYTNTAQKRKMLWSFMKMLLSSSVHNPRLIACEVWSLHFQEKLYISNSCLVVVSIFYVILLLINLLWRYYMYETWSWHTYSYAFGFLLKTGYDSDPPVQMIFKFILEIHLI